jgi:hypothetical protein
MKRQITKALGLVSLALVMAALWSCGKRSSYTEKTPEQRAEEYHKNLATSDLNLFELKGEVRSVVYPHGFLAQYSLTAPGGSADSITFTTTGLCENAPLLDGDSLLVVRNTVGAVWGFSLADGSMVMTAQYDDAGAVQSWTIGDTVYTLAYEDKCVESVSVAAGGKRTAKIDVKVQAKDELGNWTRRTLKSSDGKSVTQTRKITYY